MSKTPYTPPSNQPSNPNPTNGDKPKRPRRGGNKRNNIHIGGNTYDNYTDLQPFDQQPGEPDLWYGRFLTYCEMGSNRTILGSAKRSHAKEKPNEPVPALGGTPAGYPQAVARWNWKQRAIAYDKFKRKEAAEEAKQERLAERENRITLLRATRSKAVEMLQKLEVRVDPEETVSWNTYVNLMRLVLQEMRVEFNDGPATRATEDQAMAMVEESEDTFSALAKAAEAARAKLKAHHDQINSNMVQTKPTNPNELDNEPAVVTTSNEASKAKG